MDGTFYTVDNQIVFRIELMANLDQVRILREEVKERKDEEKRLHKTIMVIRFTLYLD